MIYSWLGILPRVCSRNAVILARNASGMTTESGPVASAIRRGLEATFSPVHLEIINESHMHNVPPSSETHFKVLVVSTQFDGVPLVKRHRMVNEAVKNALEGAFVHALSLETKTPSQWDSASKVDPSPKCLGGFGR
ncbi:bolA-like protein DDB_G0274169 [Phlebotomus argentipes]|uniref:bolA-like protein DDB_G0274169 n=1 Tax=Phlebotomus argentipes TaxID=94469 RepID=UPI00289367BD|nr:bolA-like protein DDB_G0274169 [Phlebotomus argentipes]